MQVLTMKRIKETTLMEHDFFLSFIFSSLHSNLFLAQNLIYQCLLDAMSVDVKLEFAYYGIFRESLPN